MFVQQLPWIFSNLGVMIALVGGTALADVMKAKRSSTSDVAQYFGRLLRTRSETAEC